MHGHVGNGGGGGPGTPPFTAPPAAAPAIGAAASATYPAIFARLPKNSVSAYESVDALANESRSDSAVASDYVNVCGCGIPSF